MPQPPTGTILSCAPAMSGHLPPSHAFPSLLAFPFAIFQNTAAFPLPSLLKTLLQPCLWSLFPDESSSVTTTRNETSLNIFCAQPNSKTEEASGSGVKVKGGQHMDWALSLKHLELTGRIQGSSLKPGRTDLLQGSWTLGTDYSDSCRKCPFIDPLHQLRAIHRDDYCVLFFFIMVMCSIV